MTERVQEILRKAFINNLRAFAKDEDELDIEFANELRAIADRLENGTATEADWIEAIQQLDING